MSITDELRAWLARKFPVIDKEWHEEFTAIANRIDVEHERAEQDLIDANNQMEQLCECSIGLPVDADGEYIHIGDVLDPPADCDDYPPMQVMRLMYDGYEQEWFFDGDVGGFCGMVGEHMDVAGWTHHHEPTVEDVLRDVVTLCHNTWKEESPFHFYDVDDVMKSGNIAEFASRLRLAGDAE